jgi:hypothetical protein
LHFVYSKKYNKNTLNYPSQQQQQEKQTKEERQREQQQKQQKEEGETEPRSIQFPYITTIRSNGQPPNFPYYLNNMFVLQARHQLQTLSSSSSSSSFSFLWLSLYLSFANELLISLTLLS